MLIQIGSCYCLITNDTYYITYVSGCSPNKLTPLNIALPFSFIDFYRKTKGKDVGSAINKYGNRDIRWVSHGMLRIDVSVMKDLFEVSFHYLVNDFYQSQALSFVTHKTNYFANTKKSI